MVLPAWRDTTNPMAINDVRCIDDCSRENGKQHKQQLRLEMPSFSNVGLYGSKQKLQLSDNCVRKAGVTLPTGRKWAVQWAVDEATSCLKH